MKILFVTNRLQIGGAEILMRDILLKMGERGHEVAMFILDSCGGPIEGELLKIGTRIFYGSGKSNSSTHVFQIARHLVKNKYDIIHSHLYPAQLWTAFACKVIFAHTPLITTEHNTYYKRRERLKYRLLDRVMYPLYNHIICISNAVQQTLLALNCIKSNQLSVIDNGINLDRFLLRSASAKSREPNVTINILAVGRLDQQKNYPFLISAINKVSNVALTIAGDGPLRKSLEDLARSFGVNNRVHFAGNCTNIPALMRESDFFIQASSWEGFGIAAVEAMSSGLPVIVSRVPGLTDVVGDAGLQFDPDNEKQLVECIRTLINDKKLRETLAKKGRERAELFSIDKTVDGYLQVYKNCLKQNREQYRA